ncbi:MAG: cupin domain-containing protein [Bacteroidales bacterium]|jgi:quercetin dioxygenase-like cupin family protein|nr:cupin domain-containing protein [Bacteroidales bacterium]MCK9448595.1 cupin domain-containing protein [Bacteroidales bacterium]MDD3700991.1 cupin domain-containing protein [Bacteroidales bacterium]MDY0369116.1 cupin domain-containing protein [Bacteroidales bacterium]
MTQFPSKQLFEFKNEVEYAKGSVVSRQVVKNEKGNVTLFAFDKDQGLSEHTAPFDALVQVIDGKAEILIGGESYILQEGQSIIMPAHVPHALKATEKFKMILTMIRA